MVISRVDRHILKSVAEMDGIRCGLLEIARTSGFSYQQIHARLGVLESARLLRVNRRGRGRRLLISATSLGLIVFMRTHISRVGVPVCVPSGLQITESKYEQ